MYKVDTVLYSAWVMPSGATQVLTSQFVRIHESGRCVVRNDGVKIVGRFPSEYFTSRSAALKAAKMYRSVTKTDRPVKVYP
jgi:hypothetical protein